MRHLRHAWPALAVVAVNPAMAFANHPSLRLTDAAIPRFEALSFFLLLLVVSSLVVWRVWNALRADFPHLLRRRAIAGVGEAHPAARGRWVMSPTARTNCLGFSLIFGMCILCCGGFMHFLFQVPAYLAFGWVPYLARVVPELTPDPAMVATAIACFIGVVLGGHAFFRWLYANALPEPRWNERGTGRFVAPRTSTEKIVAETWCEVLGLDRVGALDHFFELGGHSLLATRVLSRLAAATGATVTLRDIVTHPTVRELAAIIDGVLIDNASAAPVAEAPTIGRADRSRYRVGDSR